MTVRIFTSAACLWLAGCFADASTFDDANDWQAEQLGPEQEAVSSAGAEPTGESRGQGVADRAPLVSLELSPTHKVQFFENNDQFILIEEFNIDEDTEGPFYSQLDRRGMNLAEVYEQLAGARFNASEHDLLVEADQAYEAKWGHRVDLVDTLGAQDFVDIEAEGAPEVTAVEPTRSDRISLQQEDLFIEKHHSSNCNVNPDWGADSNYWNGQLCDSKSWYCQFNRASTWLGRRRTNSYTVTGIAQDFCNGATLTIEEITFKPPLWCGSNGAGLKRPFAYSFRARHFVTVTFTNNGNGWCETTFDYTSSVKKWYGANPSRVGMVVNPKPWGGAAR